MGLIHVIIETIPSIKLHVKLNNLAYFIFHFKVSAGFPTHMKMTRGCQKEALIRFIPIGMPIIYIICLPPNLTNILVMTKPLHVLALTHFCLKL